MDNTPTQKQLWTMYFMSIVSMSLHPGYQKQGTEELTMRKAVELADAMLTLTNEKFPCQS